MEIPSYREDDEEEEEGKDDEIISQHYCTADNSDLNENVIKILLCFGRFGCNSYKSSDREIPKVDVDSASFQIVTN